MKQIWRKMGGFILFFCLLTGAGYFLPFLCVQSHQESTQEIVKSYEKKLIPQDEVLLPEYDSWVQENVQQLASSTVPLNKITTTTRAKLILQEEYNPAITFYNLKNLDILVFIQQHPDEDNQHFSQNVAHLQEVFTKHFDAQDITVQVISLPHINGFWGRPSVLILSQSIGFICLSGLIVILFIFIIPHIIKRRRFNKTFNTLYAQITSLCVIPSVTKETDHLLQTARKISLQTPQEAVRIIRGMLLNVCINPSENLFSPAQRAAILLIAIGPKPAKKIFKRMTDSEVNALNHLISSLGRIKQDETKMVLKEFCQAIEKAQNGDAPKTDTTEKPIYEVLPLKQATTIALKCDSNFTGKDVWGHLETVPSEKIATYLEGEYPQTSAIILYHLSDEKAGSVLNLLSPKSSGATLLRLTALKSLGRDKLKAIEAGLEVQFLGASASILYKGYQKASNILSLMNKSDKNKLIRALSYRAPQVAKRLSRQVICFDDFSDFDEENIRLLIKKTPRHILVNALLGADSATKEAFARNIDPKLWGKMLKKLSSESTNRIKDIDEAQCYIIKKARTMIENGKMKQKR